MDSRNTTSTITPTLRYSDAKARKLDWLCYAFGFQHLVAEEGDDRISRDKLTFGTSMIMSGSIQKNEYGKIIKQPREVSGLETHALSPIVDNVGAHHRHTKLSGAIIIMDPEDQPYGGRFYS